MRVPRLHFDCHLKENKLLNLDKAKIHYLMRVLRLNMQSNVRIFNDKDGDFLGEITGHRKDQISIRVNSKIAPPAIETFIPHLAIGISKGNRMDYIIQKSSELGVKRITPLYSQFGNIHFKSESQVEKKLSHWRNIAVSASEQCGRHSIPKIDSPINFLDFLSGKRASEAILLDTTGDTAINQVICDKSVCIISGPEGGLSEFELEKARNHAKIVKIGPRVLRAETAPIVALSILQNNYGDFN